MRPILRTVVVLLLAVGGALTAAAQQCEWRWVNPDPPRADILRLKHEIGVFVGVGRGGTIIRSPDGYSWTPVAGGVDSDLYGVDWGAGTFVAVGDGVVLVSPSGLDWTVVHRSGNDSIVDVEYSVSRFVAVGSGLGGNVLTSIMGDEWELVPAPWTGEAGSIAGSDEGFFVAVGTEIWFSSDGSDWQLQSTVPATAAFKGFQEHGKKTGSSLFGLDRVDLAWTGDRLFWAGGEELWSGRPGDGSWELDATLGGCFPFSDWLGLAAGNGWIVASGISGCPTPYLDPTVTMLISTDGGDTFRPPWQTELGGFPALARYGSRWVAAGAFGDVMTSSDAATWTCGGTDCTSLACEDGFFDLTRSDDGWFASGGVGLCDEQLKRRTGATTAFSMDGIGWQVSALTMDRFRGAAATANGFLAVGDGWVARSPDRQTWTEETAPNGAFLRGVAAHDGWEVVVGDRGALYVAEGGPGWFEPYLYVTEDLHRVVWGDGQFVALGANGLVLRSIDVLNWLTAPAATTAVLRGAAAGSQGWIAVGEGGTILSSPDAHVWLPERSAVDAHLTDVAWGDGRFVVVGWSEAPDGSRPAVVLSSTKGIHWTRFPVPGEALQRVGWTGDGWIVTGGDRTLMQAECIGISMEPEEEHLQVSVGQTVDLLVHLSSTVTSDSVMTVSSSKPGRLGVVPSVPIPAGSDRVFVPVTGVKVEHSAVLTLSLPDDLGGGITTTLVSVQPPEWTPRDPSGRVTP